MWTVGSDEPATNKQCDLTQFSSAFLRVHTTTVPDNEETLALILCSGAMLIISNLIFKKRKPRWWWRTELYKNRAGSELLRDLKFQHVSGQYKQFTRMSPTDFENLLNEIGLNISKKKSSFQSPISIADCSDLSREARWFRCDTNDVPTRTMISFVFVEKIDKERIKTSTLRMICSVFVVSSQLHKNVTLHVTLCSARLMYT